MSDSTAKTVKKRRRFNLNSVEELKDLAKKLAAPIEAIEDVSGLAEQVRVYGLTIPNSLAINPMEGADADSCGRPTNLTFRRYRRFASGGAGLIWSEAIAVVPQGRANPRQLLMKNENKESFKELIDNLYAAAEDYLPGHKPVTVAQLTHSGRYSRPNGIAEPLIPQRDPYRDGLCLQEKPDANVPKRIRPDRPVLTDEYLDKLIESYVEAARLAFEIGFDAVDIKSCHGYLLSELFTCHNRQGKYGGSFENRSRFLLDTIDRIHSELGENKAVTCRLGIYDAIPYPYGWGVNKDDYTKPDLTEPKKLLGLLKNRGVEMVNITLGNPYFSPHISRPFNEPIAGAYESPEHPLKGVSRLIELTGEIQKEYPQMVVVGTGYSWLRTLMANVGAAVKDAGKATLIGAGRMAFAYPDFAGDIINKGKMDAGKVCAACSGCTQIMRDGGTTGCVVRDNEVYGPVYRAGRLAAAVANGTKTTEKI